MNSRKNIIILTHVQVLVEIYYRNLSPKHTLAGCMLHKDVNFEIEACAGT